MSPISKLPVETAAERTARQLAQCRRLAELGLVLARKAAERASQALAAPTSAQGEEDPAAPDQVALFTLLARGVRQSIVLERRLAAGHVATRAPLTQTDPRRAKILLALRRATSDRTDRAELCEQADDMLDEELALDPDGTNSVADLLATICEDLGVEVDCEKRAADLDTSDLPDQAEESHEPDWPDCAPSGTPH